MVTAKIENLIHKIQSIIGHEESISRLEKDLVKGYLRELYELTEAIPLTGSSVVSKVNITPAPPQEVARYNQPPSELRPKDRALPMTPDPIISKPSLHQSMEKHESLSKSDAFVSNGHQEIVKPALLPEVEEIIVAPHVSEVFRQEVPIPQKYNALFESSQSKDLSEKLSRSPIADLTKAFSINDRLLIVSDLFAGDSQSFQDTIDILNTKYSFDEAKSYLIRYIVDRYSWSDEEKSERAREFIKLVERRYLNR